jgi:hypothetical protein
MWVLPLLPRSIRGTGLTGGMCNHRQVLFERCLASEMFGNRRLHHNIRSLWTYRDNQIASCPVVVVGWEKGQEKTISLDTCTCIVGGLLACQGHASPE